MIIALSTISRTVEEIKVTMIEYAKNSMLDKYTQNTPKTYMNNPNIKLSQRLPIDNAKPRVSQNSNLSSQS